MWTLESDLGSNPGPLLTSVCPWAIYYYALYRVPLPNSYVETLTPNVMAFEDGALVGN